MKIRLYKGPFSGKVLDYPNHTSMVKMTGPKKMTRRQRYEAMRTYIGYGPLPMVEATYEIAMMNYHQPYMHPDGSVFFAYVEGSKVER